MNAIIIGEGSERDPRSIPLSTRDRTYIPNYRMPEHPPEVRREAAKMFKQDHAAAKLRSSSSSYNCVGHVFAARRTWVESDHLSMILERDGYSPFQDIQKLWEGDVVVYENEQGEPTHVAQVTEIRLNLNIGGRTVFVLSKWGAYGEYLHELLDVPVRLGKPKAFWTERREV